MHEPPRCFITPAEWQDDEIALAPEESHHLLRVLRRRPGDSVILFDGQGRRAPARIIAGGRGSARLRVETDALEIKPSPSVKITLAQAVPAHNIMDGIVQKAVELGAGAVIPLLTERVASSGGRQHAARYERWRKIAREAARQCGADWIPEVTATRPLTDLPAAINACHRCFFGALMDGALPFQQAITAAQPLPANAEVMIVIGPEGDFTTAETAFLQKTGAVPVTFGAGIMRVETAAVYGLSILRYEFSA